MTARTHAPEPEVAPPDGRTRYANGQRRRAEIVDAATHVFAERGFQGLSMRQIAEAVGVSHTLLRHHFGTKDALLEAVLQRREEQEHQWRADLLATHGLLEAIPLIMEHNTTIRGLIQLDTMIRTEAVSPDHPAHEYVVGLAARFRNQAQADLAAEQAAGRVRADVDPEVTALEITSLIEGLQAEWLLNPSVDMAATMRAFTRRLRA